MQNLTALNHVEDRGPTPDETYETETVSPHATVAVAGSNLGKRAVHLELRQRIHQQVGRLVQDKMHGLLSDIVSDILLSELSKQRISREEFVGKVNRIKLNPLIENVPPPELQLTVSLTKELRDWMGSLVASLSDPLVPSSVPVGQASLTGSLTCVAESHPASPAAAHQNDVCEQNIQASRHHPASQAGARQNDACEQNIQASRPAPRDYERITNVIYSSREEAGLGLQQSIADLGSAFCSVKGGSPSNGWTFECQQPGCDYCVRIHPVSDLGFVIQRHKGPHAHVVEPPNDDMQGSVDTKLGSTEVGASVSASESLENRFHGEEDVDDCNNDTCGASLTPPPRGHATLPAPPLVIDLIEDINDKYSGPLLKRARLQRPADRENVLVLQDITLSVHPGDSNVRTTTVPFFLQQLDAWSGGFRNLQMLLGAIQQVSASKIVIPTILQLQQALEVAWRRGLDPDAAAFYNRTIVGTEHVIGAVEALTILYQMRVDACVVQFVRTPVSRLMLSTFCSRYFHRECCRCQCSSSIEFAHSVLQGRASRSPCTCTCQILPLFLQWEGRSVIVIGYESADADDFLMVLDSHDSHLSTPAVSGRLLRRSLADLETRDCQVLLATTNSPTDTKTGLLIVTAAGNILEP